MIQAAKNPIAIRSQEWLANALLLLMEEKDFKDISIKEIAEKADLSRRTFYRLFERKEDLLVWYMNALYQEFITELQKQGCKRFEDVVMLYFKFWYRHKHLLDLFRRSDLLSLMLNQYLVIFPDIFKAIKSNYPLSRNEEALGYAMAFSAGGLLSVLVRWSDEGMTKTPEEMLQMLDIILQVP